MNLLLCVCLLCALVAGAEENKPNDRLIPNDHRFFLRHLFNKYGHGGIISFEGFEHLLENLGIGGIKFDKAHTFIQHKKEDGSFQEIHDMLNVHDHYHKRPVRDLDASVLERKNDTIDEDLEAVKEIVDENENTLEDFYYQSPDALLTRCLSPQDLLTSYGLNPDHDLSLSPVSFLHICPAIIFELDEKSCSEVNINTAKGIHSKSSADDYRMLCVYASVTILAISVAGLLGIAIVPLLQKTFFTQILNFLVALAVGTLSGDALLHLLPHALHSKSGDETEVVLKAGCTFLTITAFFFIESILRHRHKYEEKKPEDTKGQYSIVEIQPSETIEPMKMEKPQEVHTHSHQPLEGSSITSVAFMVIIGDGLHNLTDGLAIGAAFSGGLVPGLATSVAVFTHELPHELGDFAVLLHSGMTVKQAVFYNIVSSILSFIGMVVGLFLGNFDSATEWIYAATAGSFIYIALADLVPEMNKTIQKGDNPVFNIILQLLGVLCGGGIMCLIAIYEEDLHNLIS